MASLSEETIRPAAPIDHLVPEKSPFLFMPIVAQYHRNISTVLLEPEDVKNAGIVTVVCLPSFQPEWSLRLVGNEKNGHRLLLKETDETMWGSGPLTLSVKGHEASVDAKFAAAIWDVWRKMLSRVKPITDAGVGLDGISYHFDCRGSMAGRTHSPAVATPPGKLVALCHALRDYVHMSEEERPAAWAAIQEKIAWFDSLV